MIDYNQALAIVRRKHPNDLIRECYEYKNNYIFCCSFGKKYDKEDTAIFYEYVNKNTGKIESRNLWMDLLNNGSDMAKAINNPIYIDITKEMI